MRICVSFILSNIFITLLSKNVSARLSSAFTRLGKRRVSSSSSSVTKQKTTATTSSSTKISSAFQASEHTRTSLMSCSGFHVCFLCLTCIQTQLFFFFGTRTEEQAPAADGVAERNVTGNMAAPRKAQHEPRHLADER